MKQLSLLKRPQTAYGGELLKTREGRGRPRPLATQKSMHLVLRSTQAKGEWSFKRPKHAARIRELTQTFAGRHGVKILSVANVGNHLHFHMRLSNRQTYRPFIRGLTAAIALAVTGASKLRPLSRKFWDYRPFTRIVQSYSGYLRLRDYVRINQLEGHGYSRRAARFTVAWDSGRRRPGRGTPLGA